MRNELNRNQIRPVPFQTSASSRGHILSTTLRICRAMIAAALSWGGNNKQMTRTWWEYWRERVNCGWAFCPIVKGWQTNRPATVLPRLSTSFTDDKRHWEYLKLAMITDSPCTLPFWGNSMSTKLSMLRIMCCRRRNYWHRGPGSFKRRARARLTAYEAKLHINYCKSPKQRVSALISWR